MITMLGIGLMAILIILPLLAASVFRVDALKTVFAALVKMLVRVGVLGAAVYYLVEAGSVWLDVVLRLSLSCTPLLPSSYKPSFRCAHICCLYVRECL